MIDLHIHNDYSDEAFKNSISTDYDKTEAYQDKIFKCAKEKNIKLIKGV